MTRISIEAATQTLRNQAEIINWNGQGEIPPVIRHLFALEHCCALGCPHLAPDRGRNGIRLACNRGANPVALYGDPKQHQVDPRCPSPGPTE